MILLSSVADSGPVPYSLPGSGIGFSRIPDLGSKIPNQCFESGSGMGKKIKIPGSGMNIPDHISESLETLFWVKNTYLNSFMRIRNSESSWPWSRIFLTLDPQHRKKLISDPDRLQLRKCLGFSFQFSVSREFPVCCHERIIPAYIFICYTARLHLG